MEQNTDRDPDMSSALDLIIGDTPVPKTPAKLARPAKVKDEGAGQPVTSRGQSSRPERPVAGHHSSPNRPKARNGRPPGVPDGQGKLKDKTSLRIDRDLMDHYRKQSWREECQLGELVERALRAYAAQSWGWK